jgi:hypothetical protein
VLSFEEIKKVRIVDVAGRYGIRLRFKGEWASAPCPLPNHKAGDKGRNFTINLPQNYWRCFSESCNEKNGGKKGGDVINFVALMENCRERDAAQKLADWYGLNGNKTASQIVKRVVQEASITPFPDIPDTTSPAVAGKGYIQSLDAWFDELFGIGPELKDDPFWKKCRNAVKSKCIESYKNGKLAAKT